jgi:hypothetical protein
MPDNMIPHRGTFTKTGRNTSHPCLLAPLGVLDGAMVDVEVMPRTLMRVMKKWEWKGYVGLGLSNDGDDGGALG